MRGMCARQRHSVRVCTFALAPLLAIGLETLLCRGREGPREREKQPKGTLICRGTEGPRKREKQRKETCLHVCEGVNSTGAGFQRGLRCNSTSLRLYLPREESIAGEVAGDFAGVSLRGVTIGGDGSASGFLGT